MDKDIGPDIRRMAAALEAIAERLGRLEAIAGLLVAEYIDPPDPDAESQVYLSGRPVGK